MSGFTPGPWEISGLNDRYIVGAAYRNRLNHEVTPTVAIVKERIGQTESNARLISAVTEMLLSLIHISEPTRLLSISYAVFCLKKKNKNT